MSLIPFGLVYIHRPDNHRTAARYLNTVGPGQDLLSFESLAQYHGGADRLLLAKPAQWCIVHQVYWLPEDYHRCPRCHANDPANTIINAGVMTF